MSQDITVTDLFCGAGGSSIGAEKAGARLVMAANHWRLAIDTHNTNFPHADHDCADVSQVNPRRYPRTDILIASPECTNQSGAKARKATATLWDQNPAKWAEEERSRATMWDVPRFAEHHRYDVVVVENVVEAARWVPFEAWLHAMHALGYEHRILSLNSFVAHPTPQSRDRLYVVFWRRGNRAPDLDFTADAWCPRCERRVAAVQAWKNGRRVGRYRQQYIYACPRCGSQAIPFAYPAATAIDWSLPTVRIGDRAKPLAEATLRRIRAGLERYGPAALVAAAGNTFERRPGVRSWPLTLPIPVQTTTAQHALVVDTAYSHDRGPGKVRPVIDPVMTQTGQQSQALVVPAGGTWRDEASPVGQPFPTRTTRENDALVVPLRTHGRAAPADEAVFPTFVAGNAGHALLVRNYGNEGGDPGRHVTPVDEVARAITTSPGMALLMRNNNGGAEMSTPVDEVVRTVTTMGHQSLVTIPFLTDYHGDGRPWQARGVDQPMGTVESVDRRGLVDPVDIEVEDHLARWLEAVDAALEDPVHDRRRHRVPVLADPLALVAEHDVLAREGHRRADLVRLQHSEPAVLVRRYAEGTTVPAEQSQGEIRGLLAKHGVERFGMVDGPDAAAVQFVFAGLTYRFEVRRPTVKELQDEYSASGGSGWGNVDWRGRVEREWRRRWRARVLWLKATLEFAAGEGAGEMERALLPYLVLPGGATLAAWTAEQLPEGYRRGVMPPLLLEAGA